MRSNKGINLVTLSIAIIILVVITSVLVYSAKDGVRISNLEKMYNDIETLNSKVNSYYLENNDIPKGEVYCNAAEEKNLEFINKLKESNSYNPNDGNIYYILDLKLLDGVSLNYGRDYDYVSNGNLEILTDLYVINGISHTIYYVAGVQIENAKYYTNKTDYSNVELKVIPIYTAEQLAKIGSGETVAIEEAGGEEYTFSLDGTYLLKNDIDLSKICYKVDGTAANDKSWTPIGTESAPFTGKFYGNRCEINNIYINSTSGGYYGLFGFNNGEIEDFTMYNGYISCTNGTSGMVAGYNRNKISNIDVQGGSVEGINAGGIYGSGMWKRDGTSIVEYCTNSATVRGTSYVGGIAGTNCLGVISKCINNGDVISSAQRAGGITGETNNKGRIEYCINNGNISGYNAGGITGHFAYNESPSYLLNCYNTGTVTGNNSAAGISARGLGYTSSTIGIIENCYNIGNVNSNITIGGIFGYRYHDYSGVSGTMTLDNNYWLSTCGAEYGFVADKSNKGAEPKSAEEMKTSEFVNLLNTGNDEQVWVRDTKNINNGYPILAWQNKK